MGCDERTHHPQRLSLNGVEFKRVNVMKTVMLDKNSSTEKKLINPMLEQGDLNAFWNIKAIFIVLLLLVCNQPRGAICVKSDDSINQYTPLRVSYGVKVNDKLQDHQTHCYTVIKGAYLYFHQDYDESNETYKVVKPSELHDGDLVDVTGLLHSEHYHIVAGGCKQLPSHHRKTKV